MMLDRRRFLGFLAAPAIVRASSLMAISVPREYLIEHIEMQWAAGQPWVSPRFIEWIMAGGNGDLGFVGTVGIAPSMAFVAQR